MSILDEASELINGRRAKDYGDVTENFQRIADLWYAYRYDNLEEPFTPHDVAMMMVLVKVARQSNGYHRDSAVDIAGYAALDEKVHAPVSDDFWTDYDKRMLEAQEQRERDRTSRPALPRVWDSLGEVPLGVKVTDREGDQWCGYEVDNYGPFTEILDTERAEARSSSDPASPDSADQKGSK